MRVRSLLRPADEDFDAGRNAKPTPDESFIRDLGLNPVLLAVVAYEDEPEEGFDGIGIETR
jgi:hypothetical protein